DRSRLHPIVERVEHVERRHHVERTRRKWHRRDRSARNAAAARLAREARPDFGEIEAESRAETRKKLEVGTSSASAVEKTWSRPAGDGLSEQRRNEGPEPAEPEVTRFRLRGCAQQVLHGAHCSVSNDASCIDTLGSTL